MEITTEMTTETNMEMMMKMLLPRCFCCKTTRYESFVIWLTSNHRSTEDQSRIYGTGFDPLFGRLFRQAADATEMATAGTSVGFTCGGGCNNNYKSWEPPPAKGVITTAAMETPPPSVSCCPFPFSPPQLHLVKGWQWWDQDTMVQYLIQ